MSTGFTPSELLFGRSVRSPLGLPYEVDIDYTSFEERDKLKNSKLKKMFDKKYRVSKLPELKPGDPVWINAPTDTGSKGFVTRKDKAPDSYWVSTGDSEIRRNRKHLFLFFENDSSDDEYFSSNEDEEILEQEIDPVTENNVSEELEPGRSAVTDSVVDGNRDVVVTTRSGRVSKRNIRDDMFYY